MSLYPAWKDAIKELLAGGLTYGSKVTRAEVVRLCRIRPAQDVEDVRRFDLELLRAISEIKDALLTAHCMLLVSDQAGGYLVIHPKDQTAHAVQSGTKAIAKEMRRMAAGVSFVRTDLLSHEERARNADAQAKIAALAGFVSPELKRLAG